MVTSYICQANSHPKTWPAALPARSKTILSFHLLLDGKFLKAKRTLCSYYNLDCVKGHKHLQCARQNPCILGQEGGEIKHTMENMNRPMCLLLAFIRGGFCSPSLTTTSSYTHMLRVPEPLVN